MIANLPLMHRPGVIVSLDDEPIFHRLLSRILPTGSTVEFFNEPDSFVARMQVEVFKQAKDLVHQSKLIEQWRQGEYLIPTVLRYWAEHPERHALVRICLVDYMMPGTTGLDVLQSISAWKGGRVLMTAHADEQIAVTAFNQGLIDQFIPKQRLSADIGALPVLLGRAASISSSAYGSLWAAQIKPDQQDLLQAYGENLAHFARHHWVEYVVLGDPFGILGLDACGRAWWLQLEASTHLGDLAELAESVEVPAAVLSEIRAGKQFAAVELQDQLRTSDREVQLAPTIDIGDDGVLLGALFAIAPDELPAPIPEFEPWEK